VLVNNEQQFTYFTRHKTWYIVPQPERWIGENLIKNLQITIMERCWIFRVTND